MSRRREPGCTTASAAPARRQPAPRTAPRSTGRGLGRAAADRSSRTMSGRARHVAGEPRPRRGRTAGPRRRRAARRRGPSRRRRRRAQPSSPELLDRRSTPRRDRSPNRPRCAARTAHRCTPSPGRSRYTSPAILAAEQRDPRRRRPRDGRTVDPSTHRRWPCWNRRANGVQLNPGPGADCVRELATSGARVQLALAPAGTGKTTAMRVTRPRMDRERRQRHRPGPVGRRGRGPAARRSAIRPSTDTLAKLVHAVTTGTAAPAWIDAIGPNTLVIIDEAGMAGTPDLATAIDHVISRGGSVRLVGDDQQLAAIGAGGVCATSPRHTARSTLSQVMRFTHPARQPEPRRRRRLARAARRRPRRDRVLPGPRAASTSAT